LQGVLENDDRNKFWRIWNVNFKKKDAHVTVDNLPKSKKIATVLAKRFEKACQPNDIKKDKEFKDDYYNSTQANTIGRPIYLMNLCV